VFFTVDAAVIKKYILCELLLDNLNILQSLTLHQEIPCATREALGAFVPRLGHARNTATLVHGDVYTIYGFIRVFKMTRLFDSGAMHL
jgi:hypothetical protein